MNAESLWEARYRSLEAAFEAALVYSGKVARSPKLHEVKQSRKGGTRQVVVLTSGPPCKFAFWLYEDNELVEKARYSYSNTYAFKFNSSKSYRVRIFVSLPGEKEARIKKEVVIGGKR